MLDFVEDRCAFLGVVPGDEAARAASVRRNFEFFDAPTVAFLCLHRDLSPWSYFDMGLFAQSLMLAAMEYSVGSVVAVNFVAYPDVIRNELGVPDEYAIMIGIALGYADPESIENRCRSIRRPVEEAVVIKGL
jgi:nitroreductase